MRSKFFKFLSTLIILLHLGCSENLLKEFANTETDEAIFTSAMIKLNAGNYTGAITDFASLSTTKLADRNVKFHYASAYAGRCGYTEFDVLDKLGTIGATRLYLFFMQEYGGATVSNIADCIQAEDILQSIGTAAQRNDKENMFMGLLGFTKIGVIVALTADANDDNTLDGGFDACNSGSISDLYAQHVGIALAEIAGSFGALTTSIGGAAVGTLGSACTDLDSLGAQYNICDDLEPSDYDADELRATRTLIHEGTLLGLGSCPAGTPDIPNCLCP